MNANGVNAYVTAQGDLVITGTADYPITFVGINVTDSNGVKRNIVKLNASSGVDRVEILGQHANY